MKEGWYWYRAIDNSTPDLPSGEWNIIYVMDGGGVLVAGSDMSWPVHGLTGQRVGPLVPPA